MTATSLITLTIILETTIKQFTEAEASLDPVKHLHSSEMSPTNYIVQNLFKNISHWPLLQYYSVRHSVCNMFSPWILDQIRLQITVLESAHHEDFETPPTYLILLWYSRWKTRLNFQREISWKEVDFWNEINSL